MQEVETTVAPEIVWSAWEKAHATHADGGSFTPNQRVKTAKEGAKGFKYRILDVKQGESFSILWSSFFARLHFVHSVRPLPRGALIQVKFQIRGPFAWPLRWMLKKKIERNLALVLKTMARQLEEEARA